MASPSHLELLQMGVEAFNRRDAAAFKALFAPDAEMVPLRGALEGTIYRGPGAAEEFFSDLDESWSSLNVEMDEVREGEGWVLAFGLLRARGAGSGLDVEMRLAWVLRAGDGVFTRFRVFTDRAEALEAVGLKDRPED
jgi:ketosteroid isomerase-like protein